MDEEVITSQHWGVLLRAIVTDAALCTFRHEGRKPDLRCALHRGLLCGQSGLMHARLLLTQHFLAVAVDSMLRCSPSHGSGHSMIPMSVDFRPTLRRILHELTEGGRSRRSEAI